MYINIPFELNDPVYIIVDIPHRYTKWVPPDYSLGGDEDGPYDNNVIGNEPKTKIYLSEIKQNNIKILPPDINLSSNKYKIEEIFSNEEDAHWNLLLQLQKEKQKPRKSFKLK